MGVGTKELQQSVVQHRMWPQSPSNSSSSSSMEASTKKQNKYSKILMLVSGPCESIMLVSGPCEAIMNCLSGGQQINIYEAHNVCSSLAAL